MKRTARRTSLLVVTAVPALLSALPFIIGCSRESARPNIVVVLLDAVRRDFTGCGGAESSTPNLDRLMSEAHLPYDPPADYRKAHLSDLAQGDHVGTRWANEVNAGLHHDEHIDWDRVKRLYAGGRRRGGPPARRDPGEAEIARALR